MDEIALHVLDVAENSIAARATLIEVRVVEDGTADHMTVKIADDGQGMSPEMLDMVKDPFFTTKAGRRTGLGIPLLAQAAREAGGDFSIESAPGVGTLMVATLGLGHPDRMPLGDLRETMAVLACAHPEVDFVCAHTRDGEMLFHLDTREPGKAGMIEQGG
ncbi:MAG: ATP-binding protein [Planctomycetota bacterium]|jgi:nitrogen-specific signal transduction histidine kinase